MRYDKLTSKEAEQEAARRGWKIESNQNGVSRIEIDGAVIDSGSPYTSIELSIPAKPKKVTRYRLVVKLPGALGDVETALGDYETHYEANTRLGEIGLEDRFAEIREVEVEEV